MAVGAAIIFLASYIYFSGTTKAVVVCTDDSTLHNPQTTEPILSQHTKQNVTSTKEINQCSSFRLLRVRFLIVSLISMLLVVVIPFSSLRQTPFLKSYALNHLNQSISARKPVNITITRINSSNQNSMTTTVNVNLTRKFLSYWEKNNVALVIHFNQNYYQRIDFLTIYRELFPIVIFTGPDPHSKVLHCPDGGKGSYAYICLTRVIALYPNYTGYLMAHFDTFSQGQSLSLTDHAQSKSDKYYKLIVRDVAEILFEFKILKKTTSSIENELSLLHLNCEGCEYDVIERLVTTGLIKYIRHLQFGSHRPIEMQSVVAERYCLLQSSLKNSHECIFGIPWGWERWTYRNR
ncbi:unnamed protein product [Adineta steineri]|uniref:Uncharacterized protein n=1 Tax=Adineta steineri TaxID=433720 RepID=A0A815RRC2_9BILA|nr:unnamed protein product [Adineta steineri]